MMTTSTQNGSPRRITNASSELGTTASPPAQPGTPEGPIASRLRSRGSITKPRMPQALGQRRRTHVNRLRGFDASSSASVSPATPTALANAVDGPVASRLRSRTKAAKPHGSETLRRRRNGNQTPVATRNSPPTTTPQTTPPLTPSSQRRGRKRDASFLTGDSTVSEALRSPLAFSPDAAAVTPANTPPPPKRRRSPVAVFDRTIARALSPSLSCEWKTTRFLEQRRAMEKDSGQSLAHYASLAEAAAAGVAFSTREGFMPSEAGWEAQSDDGWARAGPQPAGGVFGAPGEGGVAVKEEELLWEGCSGCELWGAASKISLANCNGVQNDILHAGGPKLVLQNNCNWIGSMHIRVVPPPQLQSATTQDEGLNNVPGKLLFFNETNETKHIEVCGVGDVEKEISLSDRCRAIWISNVRDINVALKCGAGVY
ncbi:hypothetical protein FGB62_60g07 [Gracilaria domingensis]|nr:hypothetical protein FGB62_60g07 [Gracilaria domingensis]